MIYRLSIGKKTYVKEVTQKTAGLLDLTVMAFELIGLVIALAGIVGLVYLMYAII